MAKHMSDEYWHDLLLAARTSGLTDAMWCEKHDLSRSSFYYQLRKLRNRGVDIPESSGACRLETKQEVVPVNLFEEAPISTTIPNSYSAPALCLYLNGSKIEISNHADTSLIQTTLQAVSSLC